MGGGNDRDKERRMAIRPYSRKREYKEVFL